MRALVVIFALLGIIGTGGLGAIVQAAFSEAAKEGNDMSGLSKEVDTYKAQLASMPDNPDKPTMVAVLDSSKSALDQLMSLPYVFFGAAGVGLLMMILSVAKIGPKPLHGVLFIGAGAAPAGLTYSIFGTIGELANVLAKIDPSASAPFPPDVISTVNMVVLGAGGGLILAGICSFFVNRD